MDCPRRRTTQPPTQMRQMAKRTLFSIGSFLVLLFLLLLFLSPWRVNVKLSAPAHEATTSEGASTAMRPASLVLPESIVRLDRTEIVRPRLTEEELATPMPFRVALRMRNLDELRTRIANGESISPEEMVERYYPTTAHFQQVSVWLATIGLKVQPADLTRLSVSAEGTTAMVSQAFQIEFCPRSWPRRQGIFVGNFRSLDSGSIWRICSGR